MRTIGLEISSTEFLAVAKSDNLESLLSLDDGHTTCPGIVYHDGREFISGRLAEKHRRTHPRLISDSFLDNLSLQHSEISVSGNTPRFSELAFHYLKFVCQKLTIDKLPIDKVTIALQSSFLSDERSNEERIGILLGIANDLDIPLTGIVDISCASLLGADQFFEIKNRAILYVDIHQNATEVTLLNSANQIKVVKSTSIRNFGFSQILDDLLAWLSNHFLSQTTFDVTHNRNTEQEFYNQIVKLLKNINTVHERDLEIVGKSRSWRTTIRRDFILNYLEQTCNRITDKINKLLTEESLSYKNCLILLSERANRLVGLDEAISKNSNLEVRILPEGAAAKGAARYGIDKDLVSDIEETPIITAINFSNDGIKQLNEDSNATEDIPTTDSNLPTHLVYEGRAYSLTVLSSEKQSNKVSVSHLVPDLNFCKTSEININAGTIELIPDSQIEIKINGSICHQPTVLRIGDNVSFHEDDNIVEILLISVDCI